MYLDMDIPNWIDLDTLRIQPYFLRKCDWGIIYYSLEGEVASQTVFGSIGYVVVSINGKSMDHLWTIWMIDGS